MICPECKSEYREGYVRCRECDVDLIEPPAAEPEIELVKVYECGNAALVPVVKSLFADAGIEYMTKGESLQELFGLGSFGTHLNYAVGSVQFYVTADVAEEARAIVEGLQASDGAIADEDDQPG